MIPTHFEDDLLNIPFFLGVLFIDKARLTFLVVRFAALVKKKIIKKIRTGTKIVSHASQASHFVISLRMC